MTTLFRWLTAGLAGAALCLLVVRLADADRHPDREPLPRLDPAEAAWRGEAPVSPTKADVESLFAASSSAAGSPAARAASPAARFASFPIGQPKVIEVAMDSATRDRLTPRERQDQV